MSDDDRYQEIFTSCLVKMDNNISFNKWGCFEKLYRLCKTHMYKQYNCKEIVKNINCIYIEQKSKNFFDLGWPEKV